MLAYRLGRPLWKTYARLGGTIKIRIAVMQDEEAGVFVATSPDLRGLVCEASTINELINEVNSSVCDLMDVEFNGHPLKKFPKTDMKLFPA